MHKTIGTIAFALLGLSACRASVQAKVDTSSTSTQVPASLIDTPSAAQVTPPPPQPPSSTLETTYFGVARRLKLRPTDAPPVCSCVNALVGRSTNAAFDWQGDRTVVGADALVVAIGASDKCEHPGRGPSIYAVDRHGDDVIVVLEDRPRSSPQVQGAIIPNPGPSGAIYLRARKGSPYGRPLTKASGEPGQLCRIGTGVQGPSPQMMGTDERTLD